MLKEIFFLVFSLSKGKYSYLKNCQLKLHLLHFLFGKEQHFSGVFELFSVAWHCTTSVQTEGLQILVKATF